MKDVVVNLIELSSAEDRASQEIQFVKFRFQNPKFFVVSLIELARDCWFFVSSILLYISLSS